MEYRDILQAAHAAAREALVGKNEDRMSLNCGFQWVVVQDGRHPFVNWCRQNLKSNPKEESLFGYKAYPKGWEWWNVGGSMAQDVDLKRIAGVAFVEVLLSHNIPAVVRTRLD
jgi:hypothetical protein